MATTIRRPRPGHPKMASVITAPPSRYPNNTAMIVITGSKEIFNTCFQRTYPSDKPFAYATRTKSAPIDSEIDDFRNRMSTAVPQAPRVTDGRIRNRADWIGFFVTLTYPDAGSQCSDTAKRSVSRMPSQNVGVARARAFAIAINRLRE